MFFDKRFKMSESPKLEVFPHVSYQYFKTLHVIVSVLYIKICLVDKAHRIWYSTLLNSSQHR